MQKVSVEEFLNLDAAGMAGKMVEVDGRQLTIPIPVIRVGAGTVKEVPALAAAALGHKPKKAVVVFDEAIRAFVTDKVIRPIEANGLPLQELALASDHPDHFLVASDAVGDAAAERLDPDTDFLIAAGSGVIGDLTKWMANKTGIPFIIVGTAASMNGHASITAAMTFGTIKDTAYNLKVADAVIYDTEILAETPLEMNLSGLSDMLARNTCNADWKLSELLRGIDNFISLPYDMMAKTQAETLAQADKIPACDPDALAALGEACLISGMTMTIIGGVTSPSSGVEHVISHFWDLLGDMHGKAHFWHGTQVGVGTLIGLALYDMIRELDPAQIDPQALLQKRRSLAEIEAHLRATYPDNADYFLKTVYEKRINDEEYVAYVQEILDRWDSIWQAVDPYLMPFKELQRPMKAATAATTLAEVHQTPATAKQAILDGNFYRPRYTVLDLAWELGVFPQRVDELLARAEVV